MAKTRRLAKLINKIDRALCIVKNDTKMPECPHCFSSEAVVKALRKELNPLVNTAIDSRFWCWSCSIAFTAAPVTYIPPVVQEALDFLDSDSPIFGEVTEADNV